MEEVYLLSINNGNFEHINDLYKLYIKYNLYDKAIKLCLSMEEKHNLNMDYNIAEIYFSNKKYDLAEKYYVRCILNNVNIDYYNLINIYELNGKYIKFIYDKKINIILNLIYFSDIDQHDKYYQLLVKYNFCECLYNLRFYVKKLKANILDMLINMKIKIIIN